MDDFDATSGQHRVAYDAVTLAEAARPLVAEEWLCLSSERIKVLGPGGRRGMALACGPQGLPMWGKVKGYPNWPALVVGAADCAHHTSGRIKTDALFPLAVQYFGSAEHGRLGVPQKEGLPGATSFEDGLADKALVKGVNAALKAALQQLEEYLLKGTLPDKMGGEDWPDEPEWVSDDEGDDADVARGPPPPGSAAEWWATAPGERPAAAAALPWQVSPQVTVLSLGRIEYIRPAYHTPKCLYPIGYAALRREGDASGTTWRCEVLDGGDAPTFRVTGPLAADGTTVAKGGCFYEAQHPTNAWAAAMQRVGGKRVGEENSAAAAAAALPAPPPRGAPGGAEIFGLSHKRVAAALQRLPDAPRCGSYACWEGGPKPRAPPPNAAQRLAAESRASAHLRLPAGITPVLLPVPADRCSVCHGAVEWDDDQLVQCDGCRLLVHQRCYGIAERPDGRPWQCATCALGLPQAPPCVLCPVAGGAMKRTTCGRWCHVACAQWIPETSFGDPDAVEPVDGIQRIGKARLSLRCNLCRQPYGACIQCAGGRTCYSTYHPLCARARGYTMEVREVAQAPPPPLPVPVLPPPADGVPASGAAPAAPARKRSASRAGLDTNAVTGLGDGLALASFCPKCAPRAAAASAATAGAAGAAANGDGSRATPVKGQKSRAKGGAKSKGANGGGAAVSEAAKRRQQVRLFMVAAQKGLPDNNRDGVPGCARSVPLDWSQRRLRREPAAIEAFLAKRTFVEATPYVVTGRRHMGPLLEVEDSCTPGQVYLALEAAPAGKAEEGVAPAGDDVDAMDAADVDLSPASGAKPASTAERFAAMRSTLWRRLTCGKSAIHGWGAFTKVKHCAGDMVIEYAGELVRPSVAELRERTCYDALVGAGTYVFRMDDTAVVDATRAGNMAHLINHSCSPNCYSRLVSVGGAQHIVLFALRDIPPGEELSYDYRFSGSERLPCNCAAQGCRGWVNVTHGGDSDSDDDDGPKSKGGLPPLPPDWRWARRSELSAR